MFEVPPFLLGEHLPATFRSTVKYQVPPAIAWPGDRVLWLCWIRKPCTAVSMWGESLPVIMTGHRPMCSKCGETGQHSSFCTKKAPESQCSIDQNCPLAASGTSASSMMDMPETRIGVVKPPVASASQPTFPQKTLPAVCAVVDKEKGQWLFVGRVRGNRQAAGHLSPEAPRTKYTDRTTPSSSFKPDVLDSITTTTFQQLFKKKDDTGYKN